MQSRSPSCFRIGSSLLYYNIENRLPLLKKGRILDPMNQRANTPLSLLLIPRLLVDHHLLQLVMLASIQRTWGLLAPLSYHWPPKSQRLFFRPWSGSGNKNIVEKPPHSNVRPTAPRVRALGRRKTSFLSFRSETHLWRTQSHNHSMKGRKRGLSPKFSRSQPREPLLDLRRRDLGIGKPCSWRKSFPRISILGNWIIVW